MARENLSCSKAWLHLCRHNDEPPPLTGGDKTMSKEPTIKDQRPGRHPESQFDAPKPGNVNLRISFRPALTGIPDSLPSIQTLLHQELLTGCQWFLSPIGSKDCGTIPVDKGHSRRSRRVSPAVSGERIGTSQSFLKILARRASA